MQCHRGDPVVEVVGWCNGDVDSGEDYKWILAIPHYVIVVALAIAGVFAFIGGFFAVLFTAQYPEGIRDFLVSIQRYALRVEAYVGLLTDEYPPFRMAA